MATFAVLNENTVSNIIVADTKEIAEAVTGLPCAEYTESNPAAIGYLFDGEKFVEPVVEETQALPALPDLSE